MRFLDALAKFFGGVFLFLAGLLMPLVIFSFQGLQTTTSPENFREVIHNYWLRRDWMAQAGKQLAHEMVLKTPSNNEELLLWRSLDALDEQQWMALLEYLAPASAIDPMVDQAAVAFMVWLDTPRVPPNVPLSLTTWKQEAIKNTPVMTQWLLSQFPACTPAENVLWGEAVALNDWSRAPLCVPLGQAQPLLTEGLSTAIQSAISRMPDRVNLLDPKWAPVDSLDALRTKISTLRKYISIGFFASIVLAFLGLLLVVRSWPGLFKSAGFLLWEVGISLVGGGFLLPLSQSALWEQVAGKVPAWAASSAKATMLFYISKMTKPLIIGGGILAALGGILWLAGLLLGWAHRKDKAQGERLQQPL